MRWLRRFRALYLCWRYNHTRYDRFGPIWSEKLILPDGDDPVVRVCSFCGKKL